MHKFISEFPGKKHIALLFVTVFGFSNALAYVSCENVSVKLQSSKSASFHGFDATGANGSLVFLWVPRENCEAHSGETLTSSAYVVFDQMNEASDIKKIWMSMLLAAEAQGKTIRFHASSRGSISSGALVLSPYFITTD